MKHAGTLLSVLLGGVLAFGCSQGTGAKDAAASKQPQAAPGTQVITIGGEPVVVLKRPGVTDQNQARFLEATVIPGKGMNLLQVQAYLPGKGTVELLNAPSLADTKQLLDGDDGFGNKSFSIGGAILVPYANRIRGALSSDGKTIETTLGGKKVQLPANWQGKNAGAEKHAMHGLILNSAFENVSHQDGPVESSVSGTLHAGDFGGHWLSSTDLRVQTTLKNDALEMTVTATNAGQEPLPVSIGWHPYFVFPSGNRKQARLQLPSESRALVDNYDNVFPTGKVVPVKGTPYDFSKPGGTALGELFLDDCFLNLKRDARGAAVVEISDPAANYGLRISALSPEIKAIQVYTPPDKNFVAVEPQFNLADPYNKAWGSRDTGMMTLKPGQSVSWRVRLEMFTPAAGSAH
jgi:galactose mutarotase-like enzyme